MDDFAISKITIEQRNDLLEILEDRYSQGSTIITSQLPVGEWHAYLGGERVADAICDRIVHNSHRIELDSVDSLKKEKAENKIMTMKDCLKNTIDAMRQKRPFLD